MPYDFNNKYTENKCNEYFCFDKIVEKKGEISEETESTRQFKNLGKY